MFTKEPSFALVVTACLSSDLRFNLKLKLFSALFIRPCRNTKQSASSARKKQPARSRSQAATTIKISPEHARSPGTSPVLAAVIFTKGSKTTPTPATKEFNAQEAADPCTQTATPACASKPTQKAAPTPQTAPCRS